MRQILFIYSILLYGCNKSGQEQSSYTESVVLEYDISYEQLSNILVIKNDLDPFSHEISRSDGLRGDIPVVELFENAGFKISQEVLVKYDWPQKQLIIDANQDFHELVESKLKIKGKTPCENSKEM